MTEILDKYPGPFMNVPLRNISTSTNIGTPDQFTELQTKIRQGYPAVEIGTAKFDQWQSIPKQVFEEIARLAKINDVKLSIHAPVAITLSGITQHGWSESVRENQAVNLAHVLQSAFEMAKIYGEEIKVNVHSGVFPVVEYDKEWEKKVKEYIKNNFERLKPVLEWLTGKKIEKVEDLPPWVFTKSCYVILTDPYLSHGSLYNVGSTEYFDPNTGRKEIRTVAEEIYRLNWDFWKSRLNSIWSSIQIIKYDLTVIAHDAARTLFDPSKVGIFYSAISRIDLELERVKREIEETYNYIEKFGNENMKKELENIREKLKEIELYHQKIREIKENIEKLEKIRLEDPRRYKELAQYVFDRLFRLTYHEVSLAESFLNDLGKITMKYGPPKVIKPVPEFEIEMMPKTIAESYKYLIEWYKRNDPSVLKDPEKFKKILPCVVIENILPGWTGSRPEELIQVIERTREELKRILNETLPEDIKKKIDINKLVEEKVGATLDVGHFKMFVSKGYTKEDILEWVRKLKPYIKHLHVTENYGIEDVHQLPGTSWDDIIKAQLEELRDKLAKEGLYMVLELGGWYASGFGRTFGSREAPYDLPYVLEFSGFTPYANLSYQEAIFYPGYALGISPAGTPMYNIPIYTMPPVTQYNPLTSSPFSGLPPEFGGRSPRETFTGKPLE